VFRSHRGLLEVIADPTIADAVLDRLVHMAHRLALKGDRMRKLDAASIVDELPVRDLRAEAFGLVARERRDAATTRRARLLGQSAGHQVLPTWPTRRFLGMVANRAVGQYRQLG
jgi:hypothetical protein